MYFKISNFQILEFLISLQLNQKKMFIVISCMIAGIGIGYLFRRYKFRFIHRIILTLIWLLLLLLGLEVGANEAVISQFAKLGFDAFLLATGGTLGSVIFAWILWLKPPKSSAGDLK